ncbi:hypothetical protein K435DRAFT_297955 [Dendrothele bispora CBS 962.96]|uniref:Uncharacterized protein n=1 Tax=Dendrothele bispora (strain CBS 962.96) TaxID=1314807 RepID=A0A4V4HHL2_DENBC|nr:hypothetical protein K435DRAFT_297955 [Dendrothele bispora CBS 962.96]
MAGWLHKPVRLCAHRLLIPDVLVQRVNIHSSSDHYALNRLRRFLGSPSPNAFSPEQLEQLYKSVKRHKMHSQLTPNQLSAIIGIYGRLSLPANSPRIKGRFAMRSGAKQDYWSFVLELVQDKSRLGLELNDGDRYWLMFARLQQFHSLKDVAPDRAFAALAEVHDHYEAISSRTQVPEILVPYLETLLSSKDNEHETQAINHLSDLLAVHSNIHSRLLALLWNLLIQPAESVASQPKDHFLHTMCNRLSMRHPHNSASQGRAMATHRFDPSSRRHVPLALGIPQLIASLTSTLFPLYTIPVPLSVKQWAFHQAHTVLSPSPQNSTSVRWNNLSLLALYHLSKSDSSSNAKLFRNPFPSTFEDWHIVLALGLLEIVMSDNSQIDQLRTITRNVWRTWRDGMSSNSAARPIFVERAVLSSFLKLAGKLRHTKLLEDCFDYVTVNNLLVLAETRADKAQVGCLMGNFMEASVLCHGPRWDQFLESITREPESVGVVAGIVLEELRHRQIGLAYDFYKFCRRSRISIPPSTIVALGCALSHSRYDIAVHMLRDQALSITQIESLLQAILEAIRVQRCRYLNPTLASIVARCMEQVYCQPEAKADLDTWPINYRIRYILPLLVIAGYTKETLRLIQCIHQTRSSFFTPHFFRRMLRVLLRHRQYTAAVTLYNLHGIDATPAQKDFLRRQLVLGLTGGGAVRLARRHSSECSSIPGLREMVARRVGFRLFAPDRSKSIRVLHLIRWQQRQQQDSGERSINVPAFKSTFFILINSKRPIAALRLFQSHVSSLDPTSKTWFGNVFLHRLLRYSTRTRNERGIKKVFETKRFLTRRMGFEEDRVTVNIIVKALLRWKHVFDAENVQALFDNLVRSGYPAAARWRRKNNVPFGTRATSGVSSSVASSWLSNLSSEISFERHTKPLYKMFIKAFHVRQDVSSAQTVVGILKEEEAKAICVAQRQRVGMRECVM